MGVNLPTTHVVVWDTTFPGQGRLGAPELLQMMGRAGRGDRAGHAVAVVKAKDGWTAEELAAALREDGLPALVSPFEGADGGRWVRNGEREATTEMSAALVAAHLARGGDLGATVEEMERFFARSLGGAGQANRVAAAVQWLTDPCRALAYVDEGQRVYLTVLGRYAAQTLLPLPYAAGIGQLLRDLMTIDAADALLGGWRSLDTLLVLQLLHESLPKLRPFSV
jgi:superfamily II helicase